MFFYLLINVLNGFAILPSICCIGTPLAETLKTAADMPIRPALRKAAYYHAVLAYRPKRRSVLWSRRNRRRWTYVSGIQLRMCMGRKHVNVISPAPSSLRLI